MPSHYQIQFFLYFNLGSCFFFISELNLRLQSSIIPRYLKELVDYYKFDFAQKFCNFILTDIE